MSVVIHSLLTEELCVYARGVLQVGWSDPAHLASR